MANNIAFQPMGKTIQLTANAVTANVATIYSDSPSNQYLVVSHEKTNGTGNPVYIRIADTAANVAIPTGSGNNAAYGIPIPPGHMFVFTGPQCSTTKPAYVSVISESDSPELYITPGEGL